MTQFADMTKLDKELNKRVGLSELLGYAAIVDDNIIMLKDGSLQAVYQLYGDDTASLTAEMQTALAVRWSEAVTRFWRENVIIETDMMRYAVSIPEVSAQFPDPVSALIDQERRFQFEQGATLYETKTFVTFTYAPPRELSTTTKKFMYSSKDQIKAKTATELHQEFNQKLTQFIEFVALGNASKFERLMGDDLISFLYECISGNRQRVGCPHQHAFLDTYLSRDEFVGGFEPKIGENHIRILAFDGFPVAVYAMYLHLLNQIAIPFRYHTRYILLDRERATKQLKRKQRNWSNKAVGLMGVVREAAGGIAKLEASAQSRSMECDVAITENESGDASYGLFTGVFVFYGKNIEILNRQVLELKHAVQQLSFVLREEKINASAAFFGSLPGHGSHNIRRNLFDSVSWSMTMPLSAVYAGQRVCPCPLYPKASPALLLAKTDESNVFWFSNFYHDIGHTLVLGPTGSGKSSLLDLMISQHRRYPNSRQIILSRDSANSVVIRSHGGYYLEATDVDTDAIAPFSTLDTPDGFAIAKRWLVDTLILNNCEMTPNRQDVLQQSLENLSRQPIHHRIFRDLEIQEEVMRKTLQTLNTGMFAALMNGTNDQLFSHTLLGINVGSLLNLESSVCQSLLQAILDKLEWSFRHNHPTLLVLDEAWMFLDHPLLCERMKAWLKTLRKYNVSVIFASQSITDVAQSAICEVIVESCHTQIFLPNHQASEAHIRPHYERFGLNASEIELLRGATPKKQYYIRQEQGRRLVDIKIDQVGQCFLGVSAERMNAFNRCYDRENDNWLPRYLRQYGLSDAAQFVERYFLEKENVA